MTSDDESPCPLCPGMGQLLGVLGTLAHYRCRDCGAQFREQAHDVDDVDALQSFSREEAGLHPFSQ